MPDGERHSAESPAENGKLKCFEKTQKEATKELGDEEKGCFSESQIPNRGRQRRSKGVAIEDGSEYQNEGRRTIDPIRVQNLNRKGQQYLPKNPQGVEKGVTVGPSYTEKCRMCQQRKFPPFSLVPSRFPDFRLNGTIQFPH